MATANGTARLVAGDQVYTLRLDFNALADFEEIVGRPVTAVFAQGADGEARVGFADIRALLLASCLPKLPNKAAAGKLIERAGVEAVSEAIGQAIAAAFPEAAVAEAGAEGTDPLESRTAEP